MQDQSDPASSIVMGMMDHSLHSMASVTDTASKVDSDCCQQDCNCPTSVSVSVVLAGLAHYNITIVSFDIPSQPQSLLISQFPNSLYRPPILT